MSPQVNTYRAKHQPCQCGCGEMADECMTGRNPWGAFTLSDEPVNDSARADKDIR